MTETKSKRARGLGSLYVRGTTWWISYYVNGKQKRESADSEKRSRAVSHQMKTLPLNSGLTCSKRPGPYSLSPDAPSGARQNSASLGKHLKELINSSR